MEFWARRPLHVNLMGMMLLIVLWYSLGLLGQWLAGALGEPWWLAPQVVLYGTLLLATLLIIRLYDRMPVSWGGIGLHRWAGRELLLGVALGGGLALLAWVPLVVGGEVHRESLNDLGYWLLLMGASAAGEELLFRGYLFQRGVELFGPVAATLLASALFAAAHIGNPHVTPLGIGVLVLGGIFFSLCYLRTGSLWLPIGAHIAWNILLAKVLGVPVSGKDFGDTLLRTIPAGPDLLTGGGFGPEGGIAGVIAMLAGIYLVAKLPLFEFSPYVHAEVFRRFHRRLFLRNMEQPPVPPPSPARPVSEPR